MHNEFSIRRAEVQDIPFLARMIILAETSGFELYSYQQMFGLDEEGIIKKIETIINNEQLGHGLTYKSFLIAELNNVRVSTCAGYIEGEHGGSSHLMTGALMSGFSTEEVIKAYSSIKKYKGVNIDKTFGTLQIDSVATLPEYRGRGIFKKLFNEHCQLARAKHCAIVEIQVWLGNQGAIEAYKKLGLEIRDTKHFTSETSTGGKVLMNKYL